MKIKKLSALLLALLMTLSLMLASCGLLDDETPSDGEAETDNSGNSGTDGSDVDTSKYGTGLAQAKTNVKLDENPDRVVHRGVKPVRFTPGTKLDGTSLDESFYLYRSSLKGNKRKAYDIIRNGLLNAESEIEMSAPVRSEEVFEIYSMVVYDDPELFYVETSASWSRNNAGMVTVIEPGYNDLVNDIEGNRKKIEKASENALAALWNMKSDIEKIKYAHDYLTHINDYQLGCPYNQSAYSALVLHTTVCAGYSHAFHYLMLKNGIRAAYITGDAGGPHAWNIVMIDDETYGMDVTWDDPIGNHPDNYSYTFFNVTDRHLQNNKHYRGEASSRLPAATGTKYTYDNVFGGKEPSPDFGEGGDLPDVQPDSGDNEPDNWWENTDDENGWWNVLDESWTKNDWTEEASGRWKIYDKDSSCTYFFDESTGNFYATEDSGDSYIWSDEEEGWVPVDDFPGEGGGDDDDDNSGEFDRKRRELQNMRNRTATLANKLLSMGGTLSSEFINWVNGESKQFISKLFEIDPYNSESSYLAQYISDIDEQIQTYSQAIADIQNAINDSASQGGGVKASAATVNLFNVRRDNLTSLYYEANSVIDVYAQHIQVTQDWWNYVKSVLPDYVNKLANVNPANLTEQDAIKMINDMTNTYNSVARNVQSMYNSLAQMGIYFR